MKTTRYERNRTSIIRVNARRGDGKLFGFFYSRALSRYVFRYARSFIEIGIPEHFAVKYAGRDVPSNPPIDFFFIIIIINSANFRKLAAFV